MYLEILKKLVVDSATPAVLKSEKDFYFNEAAQFLIGYTDKEIPNIDAWFHLLYGEDVDEMYGYYLESKKEKFKTPFETVLHHKDGSLKYVKFFRNLNDNCEIWWIQDYTEQKKILSANEFELRNLNTAMLEVQRLQQKLKQENKKLKKSNAELEDFAYIASHDLKEPLRKITNFSERLKTKYYDNLDETARLYIDRMEVASNRMQLLIDDLLRYSRVSRTDIETQVLDMKRVFNTVEDKLETLIVEKGAKIIRKQLLPIKGNKILIVSLFQNIVNNGIKFQEKGRFAEIIIDSEEVSVSNKKVVRYSIEDNGIGIEQEYLKRIFKIFERLHSKDKYNGTGIGLAIVKRIVEKHNGKIAVQSELNKGTIFTIDFPE
jgi:signal transduction histidine kinase